MPLITLSVLKFNFNAVNFISWLIRIITIFNISAYIYFLQFGNFIEVSDFYYLGFSSHNAAGGFLAIIVSFSIILFLYKRNFINITIVVFNTFTLFETGSRGSYLAVIIASIFMVLFVKKYYKTIFISIFIGMIAHAAVLSWGHEQHHKIWDENDFYAMDTIELDVRNSNNISHRIVKVWPWAVDDFLSSPIIGTGFSTFNDRNQSPEEILPGIKLRVLKENIYNSGHAHHSYLNILAELGLVGFTLLSLLLLSIYKEIIKLEDFEKYLCLFSFVTLLLMSLTEHRLVAPSQAFIFFVVFSLIANNVVSIKQNKF
jgi:O-antigen ligase